ncbi:interferon gamma receptor 2 isoform 2 precursor [Daubentonia madagascariensis]|uniref:Interferon gamma receptor 2 isoform 2 n=1 Tax=Daubentonia madagascariensis TaxID=31869 RepID=A0ABD2F9T2_DAUMA
MQPPPPLLRPLLWLALLPLAAAAPPPDSLGQLPAPQHPRIHLYNAQQVLSWEPVVLSNSTRPVVYRVQFKYTASEWFEVTLESVGVNCTQITATECNFTAAGLSKGFPMDFNITLRLRAELGELHSAWVTMPWFQHYLNVTIGPPENIRVTPGEGSLIISFSPPFDVNTATASFCYYVHYWEKAGIQQYLKDPAQPILEDLDKNSSPKDDAWDSVSIVSFPEKEQEDVLQTL